MIRLLKAELMKIRRSLIWLVVIGIPIFVFATLSLGLNGVDETLTWQIVRLIGTGQWVYFLLPMGATVITALMGQVEYRPNTWSYVLALPYGKWQVFIAKAVIAVMLMGVVSIGIGLAIVGAGTLHEATHEGTRIAGSMQIGTLAERLFNVWLSSFLVTAVQFFVAMRVGGLAIPLLVGIGGTTFSVVVGATSLLGLSGDNGNFVPWLLPSNIIQNNAESVSQSLLVGGVGGAIAFLVASLLLARKDWH